MKKLLSDQLRTAQVQSAVPFSIRDEIWARLEEYRHLVVLEVRILFWRETFTLGELFPLFARIIGQPAAPVLADRTMRR